MKFYDDLIKIYGDFLNNIKFFFIFLIIFLLFAFVFIQYFATYSHQYTMTVNIDNEIVHKILDFKKFHNNQSCISKSTKVVGTDFGSRLKENIYLRGHGYPYGSGLFDPYFSATKIRWILDNNKISKQLIQSNNLLFGTIDTWLLWNLTQGDSHITDITNASRTMLFDVQKNQWSSDFSPMYRLNKSPNVILLASE